MKKPSVQETIREDGLHIITKNLSHAKSVIISITTRNGSADDPPDINGLHHFFEHMGFKGTKDKDLNKLKRLMERYIYGQNAVTDNTETTYYGSTPANRLIEACSILFDTYLNSTYLPSEIEIEKNVVLTEIIQREEDDGTKAYYGLTQLLWKENPIRKDDSGMLEGLSRINQDTLISRRDQIHIPSETVIIGCGKIDHDQLVKIVNNFFEVKHAETKIKAWDDEFESLPERQYSSCKSTNAQIATIHCGFKIPQTIYNSRETYAPLSILIKILAQGFDSILWNEIREKRGLVYSISGGTHGHPKLARCLIFHSKAMTRYQEEVAKLVPDILVNPIITFDHFRNVKEALIDRWPISMTGPAGWREELEDKMIWKIKSANYFKDYTQQWVRVLKKVTFEEVLEMHKSLFKAERIATFVAKPE